MAEKKRRPGRKPRITEDLIQKISEYIAGGLTKKSACQACALSESALYEYIRRGEADEDAGLDTIYVQFAQSIKEAEAQFQLRPLGNIAQAGASGSWQASAWLLERCYRGSYGKAALDLNVAGQPGGEPVKTESAVRVYLPSNGRDNQRN